MPKITKKRVTDWVITFAITILVTLLSYGYYQLTSEGGEGRRLLSRMTADVGMILIGISFMMSSMAFYFGKFFQRRLNLRQHLGLIGFYIILIHVYITLDFALRNPKSALSTGWRVTSFIFAISSTVIFLHMALVSNTTSMKLLGSKGWRVFLRVGGYSAFIYGVIHLAIRKIDLWKEWFAGELSLLPPLSLFVTLFAFLVVVMRVILWVVTSRKSERIEEES